MFFGRLERRKGVQVLLEALPIVLSAHPSVHVVLIGGDMGGDAGADALNVAPLVSALGDRVMRLGELPRDQALAIVARAELAIVPSLWESFGYVAVEAMALRVPVIASRVGGLAEIIDEGVGGWLVPAGDSRLLGAAIAARLRDPKELLAARESAGARAEAFDVDHLLDAVMALFDEAIVGSDRAQRARLKLPGRRSTGPVR